MKLALILIGMVMLTHAFPQSFTPIPNQEDQESRLPTDNGELNDRPIIGILTQKSGSEVAQYGPQYIAASYIKWIESAGGRVTVLKYDESPEVLTDLFSKINGVLFPGGGADLSANSTFRNTATLLYNLAIEANKNGQHFPIWGTCLGFQTLNVITANNISVLSGFDSENITLPLDFTSDPSKSRMFGFAGQEIVKILGSQPVTMNNHHSGVTPERFNSDPHLSSFFNLLSTNKDREGKEFVSSIEGKEFPIYGTQWHPEKPLFEWNPNEVINHSFDSVVANRFTNTFFVNEARKNTHHFANKQEEYDALIYNYNPVYTEKLDPSFEQSYFFKNTM
eukprot:TRINITY_DN4762_c0_g1_i1.p1 TRINITY_DN4762_c0_g1~~TRINITY_DN4762_c0_g1_i1.p1  ORF type:complete len:378 (+),score=134.15 TRINITY_DN4762_c0_g1_i1:129-1136(+)